MIEYDLHIHSNFSDGVLSPEKIFEISSLKGLRGISITDHDTVNALESCEKLSGDFKIDLIPGIELSTELKNSEVHILGYFIDFRNENFIKVLNELQNERYARIEKMVAKIQKMGFDISINEIKNSSCSVNSVGRPHIARILVNKGYFKNAAEVFEKLIGNGMPGYVERYKLATEDGIKLIKEYSGVPVAAHPFLSVNANENVEDLIMILKKQGIEGIEVYHSEQSEEQSSLLNTIAIRNKLLITGGSDFHDFADESSLIGAKGIAFSHIEKMRSSNKKIN